MRAGGLGHANICFNADASLGKARQTAAISARIGIAQGDHNTRNSGRNQSFGTGRCLAVMVARLQGDIGCGTLGGAACLREGLGFGMWPAARLGKTAPQQDALRAHGERYVAQHGTDPVLDESCTVDLSQSAARQKSVSRAALATFRRNSGRIWSTARRRWLIPRERAACMGYAVYGDMAAAAGVEVDTATEQGPQYSIGNAMHVANLGCVLMTCLVAADEPLRRS